MINVLALSSQTFTDISFQGSTAYKQGEKQPYTGRYVDFYPGDPKVKGQFINGQKDGTFTYYERDYHLVATRIENYKLGKRHGEFLGYYSDEYPEFKETYIDDRLHGECLYWAPTGEMERVMVYDKGKLISSNTFPLDTSIYRLSVYIEGEEEWQGTKAIRKEVLCGKPFRLRVAKIVYIHDSEFERHDTICILDNYKVESFGIGGPLYIDPCCESTAHIDWYMESKTDLLDIGRIRNRYPRYLWLDQVFIIDPNGHKYYLPDIKYTIIN